MINCSDIVTKEYIDMNSSIQFVKTKPPNPIEGMLYFDETSYETYVYLNGSWVKFAAANTLERKDVISEIVEESDGYDNAMKNISWLTNILKMAKENPAIRDNLKELVLVSKIFSEEKVDIMFSFNGDS